MALWLFILIGSGIWLHAQDGGLETIPGWLLLWNAVMALFVVLAAWSGRWSKSERKARKQPELVHQKPGQ